MELDKAAILRKSIGLVMHNAGMQATLRQSNKAYDHVRSKVARCLKVQSKVSKQNKRKKAHEKLMEVSEEAQLNHKLSVEPVGLKFGPKNTSWVEKTRESMRTREEEVRSREQEVSELEETLKARRSNQFVPELHHSPSYPNLLEDGPSNVNTGYVEQPVTQVDSSIERPEEVPSEEVVMDEQGVFNV